MHTMHFYAAHDPIRLTHKSIKSMLCPFEVGASAEQ